MVCNFMKEIEATPIHRLNRSPRQNYTDEEATCAIYILTPISP